MEPAATPPKKISTGRQIAGIAALIVVVIVGYRACLSEDQRDAVNQVSSVVGLPVTPWIDRAQTALRVQLAKKDQQDVIARSVVGFLHPTGDAPRIETFEVSAIGETVVARLVVAWKGGILGTHYKTAVTWKCTKSQNLGVDLTSDDGPFGVGDSNLKKLSEWFQTEVYPVLLSNAG
jgi:hypothetical protein